MRKPLAGHVSSSKIIFWISGNWRVWVECVVAEVNAWYQGALRWQELPTRYIQGCSVILVQRFWWIRRINRGRSDHVESGARSRFGVFWASSTTTNWSRRFRENFQLNRDLGPKSECPCWVKSAGAAFVRCPGLSSNRKVVPHIAIWSICRPTSTEISDWRWWDQIGERAHAAFFWSLVSHDNSIIYPCIE